MVSARVFLLFLCSVSAWAQVQESVTVVASRLPVSPSRRLLVWQRQDLQALPLRDWSDVLRLAAGVGLARRGVFGVQADASLAGAPFEGVLVLVNGVPVNDPQTGHFHLDVPIPLEAIQQVEVLTGAASPLFGAGAVGGIVAITTREVEGLRAGIAVGAYSFSAGSLSLGLGSGWGLFLERKESRGFRADSDFHLSKVALTGSQHLGRWQLTTIVATGGQQFGAWTFYSSRFPHQRERTSAGLFTLQARRPLGPTRELVVSLGARQHRDVYLLDRTRPQWYRNRHRNRQGYVSVSLQGEEGPWSWAFGVDGQRQLLSSSRLGLHQRNSLGLFAEAGAAWGGWSFHLQTRQDWYPGQARWTPGVSATYSWSSGASLGLSASSAFRLPSFTELYYSSPASMGNPNLEPEKAWTGEVVLALPQNGITWQLGIFRRWAQDLVDWVRSDSGIYVAQNYARAITSGITVDARGGETPFSWRTSLSYLHSTIHVEPTRSAYALTHPQWEASFAGTAQIGRGKLAPTLSYRKPQGRGGFFLADVSLSWPVWPQMRWVLEVFNLLDRSYQEVPGVPQPGRWWTLGVAWTK